MFLFESGCSSFVTPTNDEGLPYNDMKWHVLQVKREGKRATIAIDIRWTGLIDTNVKIRKFPFIDNRVQRFK